MQRPHPTEYKPYFQRYIDLVPGGSFSDLVADNTKRVIDFFSIIPAEKLDYRYAAGKWTIKDILQHINDTERVMAYRALVTARGDSQTPLHTMDEDFYAANANGSSRSIESLIAEFSAIRESTVHLFSNVSEEQTRAQGNAIDYKVTPRALAWIILGHPLHHINVINQRYL